MAILGDHNCSTWKTSFDFGSNFAFNYIVNQQFTNYFNGPDQEIIYLELPVLMYLKSIKDDKRRKEVIQMIAEKRYCSSTTLKLKSEIKESETSKQIKTYGQYYLDKTKNCLNKLKQSDSKQALIQISNGLV